MLPRFLRHWAACILTFQAKEIGGLLYDYKNGRWDDLSTWNTDEEADIAMGMLDAMLRNQRDEIYIVCVKLKGFGRGYLVVYDSKYGIYRRDFWMGVYDPDEALVDVSKHCRKVADKMGYRRPDGESNTGTDATPLSPSNY